MSRQLVLEKKTNCSFCGMVRECVTANESGHSVCLYCIQNFQEAMGELEIGAIQCPACKEYDYISVTMKNGAVIEYQGSVFAGSNVVSYSIVRFSGEFHAGLKISHAFCMHCGCTIPIYLLSRSDYIL